MPLTHSVRYSEPVAIRFHCPACGDRDVEGIAWTEHQLTRVLGLLQILDERLHWVRGRCCERQLLSQVPPEVLVGLQADEIETRSLLRDRVSPVKMVLLIGALLFALIPVFGLLFLVGAWWPNGSSRTWFRVSCRAVLVLHLVAMNLIALLALLSHEK